MNAITRQRMTDACAFALVFLFAYTATSKLTNHDVFQVQLERFPFISHMTMFIAWAVPLAELAAVLLLLSGRVRRMGFILSLALMTAFTLFLALMLGTEKHLPCSCGGVISVMTWKQHLIFNIFFTGIALSGLVFSPPKIKFYET